MVLKPFRYSGKGIPANALPLLVATPRAVPSITVVIKLTTVMLERLFLWSPLKQEGEDEKAPACACSENEVGKSAYDPFVSTYCAVASSIDFRLDQLRQVSQRLLPTEITSLRRNGI
jgi:hypothetical protein